MTPDTYAQAYADENSDVWHRAMDVKSSGLISAGTFCAEIDAAFGGT